MIEETPKRNEHNLNYLNIIKRANDDVYFLFHAPRSTTLAPTSLTSTNNIT
jgi:hypothetical protein